MLNSKIAMKKRLLQKYKLEPRNASSDNFFFDERVSQRKTFVPLTQSPAEERCDDEPIDVETVSSSRQTPDVAIFCNKTSDSGRVATTNTLPIHAVDEKTSDNEQDEKNSDDERLSFVSKPSLEQVVARCHLKSSESVVDTSECAASQKSAIESLKDVVNNVSSISSPMVEDGGEEQSQAIPTRQGDQSPHGVKRYLSSRSKAILSEWFRKHLYRPYPTYEEKRELAALCGISSSKVDTWFANKRNRTHNTKKFTSKYSHLF